MRSSIISVVAAFGLAGFVLAGCGQEQASNQPGDTPAAGQAATTADMSPEGNQKFLAENKAKTGVTTTASGLQYRVIKSGTGASPTPNDIVNVTYRGWLIDGTVFDETPPGQTATFPAGQLIPGWVEALQLMKEGDEWEIVLPSELGYGAQGAGGVIPPNQTLVFNMALLGVQKQ
ncbi:MAG: FKBP-type peptidyl-prolyl cis-trans isomerase [Hyphomicrobiaceae bacterium]